MKIVTDQSPRPQQRNYLLPAMTLSIVAVLACLNAVAIRDAIDARSALDEVHQAMEVTEELQEQRARLSAMMRSARRTETIDALRQAFAEVQPQSALVSIGQRQDHYYLYSPDDSVSLVIQLNTWRDKTPLLVKSADATDSKEIKIPLEAGKLHSFAFALAGDSVMFRFDDREIASIPIQKSRSGGSSRSNTPGGYGLIGLPNTLDGHYFKFSRAVEMSNWKTFADVKYRRDIPANTTGQAANPDPNVVGIVASLSSTSPKYISPNQFLAAEQQLKLQWDPKSKRYEVLGVKSE